MKKSQKDDHAVNLSKLPKQTLLSKDIFGRTLLHIAILANDVASFRKLLRSPDARHILLATDYESGWNILHYIFHYKRIACLLVLLDHLDLAPSATATAMAELLKRKDRCRLPPLALLKNDIKDAVWVPLYINEHNEFHLERRFKSSPRNKGLTAYLPFYIEHDWWLESRGGLQVYVFGSNSNSQLGLGDSTDRSVPCRVSVRGFLPKHSLEMEIRELLERPRYRIVKLSKYHSVVVTLDGRLFTCGMGSRGRLGHGNVATLYRHKSVELFEAVGPVEKVAVSNNHNVVITASNEMYAWGLNSYNQLGFTTTTQLSFKNSSEVYENSPKLVISGDLRKKSHRLLGVEVSGIHTVAYSRNAIYFWGLDIGQMGFVTSDTTPAKTSDNHRVHGVTYKGSIVPQPKMATLRDDIKFVSTSETCTCVVTVTNDIYVYFLGQRVKLPKLPVRGFHDVKFDCFKPWRLTSAPMIKKIVMKSADNIHILLEGGDVMAFSLSDAKSLRNVKYTYAWRAYDSDMRAVDVDTSFDGMMIVCTKNGSVFINTTQSQKRNGSMSTMSMPAFSTTKKKFKKVEHVNRICRVSCDESFSSFALVRDDIDLLPLKLQKNDFFVDLKYMSVLSEQDLYRKQDQLLDVDHDVNSYVTDYIYPSKPAPSNDDDDSFLVDRLGDNFAKMGILDNDEDELTDYFRVLQEQKFDHMMNSEPPGDSIYQRSENNTSMSHFLKSEAETLAFLSDPDAAVSKFCDGSIKFSTKPDLCIGFHTKLLELRSSFCKRIFHPENEGEYFIHEGIKGDYDPLTKTLTFLTDADVRALLVFLHFMYTNDVLSFWQSYPIGLKCPEEIAKVKSDFTKLMDLFRMDSLYGKREAFVKQLQQMADVKSDGDVLVTLQDGIALCHSFILVARSAFFETILSCRWETGDTITDSSQEDSRLKYVSLENVSLMQFKVILNHLHGCHDLHVFDSARSVIEDTHDSDDFVNFLLEMIEISDELLLVQLKHLCELAIKDFISTENVLILLAHADWLGAQKLFMSCSWYIYNNLEILVFDLNLCDLEEDLVRKLEEQICFLHHCKFKDFVLGDKGEVDLDYDRNALEFRKDGVESFIKNPKEFNLWYMQDIREFLRLHPELKTDSGNEESRRKLSARRMSRRTSIDPLAEFRELAQSQLAERRVSESAIADEEEFEVVTNRKRKSKLNSKLDEPLADRERSLSPTQPKPSSLEPLSTRMETNSSGLASASSTVGSNVGSSASSFAWVSRNSSTSPVTTVPILQLGENETPRQTKIKFAPSMKLSQKQRKKLAQHEPDSVAVEGPSSSAALSSAAPRNPWAATSTAESRPTGEISKLPILGAKKEATPKLAAIMLQESTRVEEQKIQEGLQRTMQDVQQEQEFAKWWEEESKRVQMEIGTSSQNNGSDGANGHGQSNAQRGRNAKLRRGRKKSVPPR